MPILAAEEAGKQAFGTFSLYHGLKGFGQKGRRCREEMAVGRQQSCRPHMLRPRVFYSSLSNSFPSFCNEVLTDLLLHCLSFPKDWSLSVESSKEAAPVTHEQGP